MAAIILICEGRQLGKLYLNKSKTCCLMAANVCSHIIYAFGMLVFVNPQSPKPQLWFIDQHLLFGMSEWSL